MNISFFTILKDGLLSAPQIEWRTTSPVNKKHLIFVSRFVVIPPFSPERETCCILSVNQLLHACLLTKWKKCNILSLFLQIHIVESTIPRRSSVPLSLQKGAAYGMLPICKAFVCLPFYKRLFHIPLQSPWGCITLWALAHTDLKITTPLSLTCESSDSHRQQTKFAAFILSPERETCCMLSFY